MDKKLITGIAVGGLLHDIGKFAERSSFYPKGDEREVKRVFRWDHPFHTDQVLIELFGERAEETISHDLMGTSSLRDLAARHHRPRNKLQSLIRCADWLAAGHERQRSDVEAKLYPMTGSTTKDQQPLISILSRINLPEIKKGPCTDMFYRIQLPELEREKTAEIMHPCTGVDYPATEVQAAYKTHWHNFAQTIRPSPDTPSSFDLIDNFDTILEICRLYQWCLPETTRRQDLSDVSLFEHQKAAAAIASCAFLYHAEQARVGGKLTAKSMQRPDTKKFVLFCGDISGIQRFVYQVSAKGAYKMLKGRSFFIQLLAEILARKYLETFGLTAANTLYCSGGKFYLLFPNLASTATRLKGLSEAVNGELFDLFSGDLYLRTGWQVLSGHDLAAAQDGSHSLSAIWDDLARQVAVDDRQRYAEMATREYERLFGAVPEVPTDSCPVCHCSMVAHGPGNGGEVCQTCLDMRTIGQRLKSARYLVMNDTASALGEPSTVTIFGKSLWFCDAEPKITTDGCFVWSLNSTDFIRLVAQARSTGVQLNGAPLVVGGNHTFDQEVKDLQFDDIARQGEGVHRLGVLRMDVDNLGRIFREGLNNYRHETYVDDRFHSLARITTLSWQLAFFFGSMVPQSMNSRPEWQGKSTVVYAGGDDLFVLGAWQTVPDIALALQSQFARFCCYNPVFALSGGMVISGGKFPIYKSAEMAGEAELMAKRHHTRFQNGREIVAKASFTFLDTAMHWREFLTIAALKETLYPVMCDNENRPLLDRLRWIFASWEKSRDELLCTGQVMGLERIRQRLAAEKWRWRMVYSLARFAERNQSLNETITTLQRFILNPVAATDRTGIELLGVLSRWCELQLRTADNRRGGDNDRNGSI